MKVLQVNKYHYVRSGTERYLFNLTRLLEGRGHRVIPFAMRHPRNEPSSYERYFLESVDFHHLSLGDRLRVPQRVLYYCAATRRIAALLDEIRPDVVHLHNIYHHISPAILPEIARRGIAIVHTLHDYQRICPSYLLLVNGAICERCRGHRYYHAPLQRCVQGAFSWSLLAGLAAAMHHWMHMYERYVGRSAVTSRFMWDKVISFGMDPARLALVPDFLFPDDFEPRFTPGRDIVYFGRLSREKGLSTLLRAMCQLPHLSLTVIGEGPLRAELEHMVTMHDLSNVQFTGYLAGQALHEVVRSARFVVVPSEWYETFGQVAIEAFALGKPVVAARIGALTELVEDGIDGRLFTPGDVDELAWVMAYMAAHPKRLVDMGRAGRRKIERHYGPASHYTTLMDVYKQAACDR